MKAFGNIQRQYEEDPAKVKAWGVIMACLAVMTGVIAAGIRQDIREKKDGEIL